MALENWQRVEELFHATLELPETAREQFLDSACGADGGLRAEVETLIAAFEGRNAFMEHPAFSMGLKSLSEGDAPELPIGRTLGSYQILEQLGKGGMGKVYLAEDTRLGRQVALKFLSHKLLNDAWGKRQLMKEAQAVAQLDHPNICGVHDFETIDEHTFIVMQYVEGETLGSLIESKRLTLEQVSALAKQIAGALAEAHSHGIIHRDIKPQNIMVTPYGQAKVLDFGLAKFVQQPPSGLHTAADNQSSQLGLVVGTVAYMSPEQLRAERLDFRSDIFSFGITLYQMLTGVNPFVRDSNADTISAILTHEIPSDATGSEDLAEIARKCLNKDRDQRYQSAAELIFDLDSARLSGGDHRLNKWRRLSSIARIAAPLLILLIALAAYLWFGRSRSQTLALLPPAVETANSDVEYLSAGLTESLINRLSHLSKLRVMPFTSVSGYKVQDSTPQEIGRRLNVDATLSANFAREGDSISIQYTLAKVADGAVLWTETFNVSASELAQLQDDISRKIISSMNIPASDKERENVFKRQTNNPEAFRNYMLGRSFWRKRDRDNLQKAIQHFEKAVDLDPVYAQAHAGLADCYFLLNLVAYGTVPTKEAMTRAKAAAAEAISLDPTLCEAHTSLGIIKSRYDWNWADAEKEFRRAIELNPDYAPAYYWYSNLLIPLGRFDEAIKASERALELDPFSPTSPRNLGRTYCYARQFDVAAGHFRGMIAKDPKDRNAQYLLGWVYVSNKMYSDGVKILEPLYAADPIFAAAPLGYAYGKMNRRADALAVLEKLEEQSRGKYIPPQEKAFIYIGLKDFDKAFTFLNQAVDERIASLIYLTTDPMFDDLRTDPRYEQLAKRIDLPL